jgi:RNA-binding protein
VTEKLAGAKLRHLKALAQKLDALLSVGKNRLSPQFMKMVNEALDRRELIKIKFAEFKEEKKELARELSEQTNSAIIQQVGHVVVLYRENPDLAKRVIFKEGKEIH